MKTDIMKDIHKFLINARINGFANSQLHEFISDRVKVIDLLRDGADPNQQNLFGNTPLNMAIYNGYEEIVAELLRFHANPNLASANSGDFPLHLAAAIGKRQIVKYLLEAGADVNQANKTGKTPLLIAVSMGYKEIAEDLLAHGAKWNTPDMSGDTPLSRAHADIKPVLRAVSIYSC